MIDIYDIVECYRLLSPYYRLNPIICGSSALFLQNKINRYPNDIDILFMMSKANFLNYVKLHKIIKPKFNCKVDWHFNEDTISNSYIELSIDGLDIKVQPYDLVIHYINDFVDNKYNKMWTKHLADLNNYINYDS